MRLVVTLLTFLLFAFVLGFVATNLETEVSIRVFEAAHEGVPLYLVVILAVFVGILYAGTIAVAEGAHIRLANRRLSRDVHKLETEVNYLRTQPRTRRDIPTALPPGPRAERVEEDDAGLPSAPVYDSVDDEPETDDEMYTGGRAV